PSTLHQPSSACYAAPSPTLGNDPPRNVIRTPSNSVRGLKRQPADERALRMTWTPEQQKHYDTLIRQGYSPDDARMLVAFTRDRGDTPSRPKPKPTFDYKADLDARLAGPMGFAEGVQRFGRGFLETMGEAAGAPPVERTAPQAKATEAIAAQRAPEPEAAPAEKPNLPG